MTNVVKRCVAEFLGTFILVAIGPGAAMVSASTHAFGQAGIALAFGLGPAVVGHLWTGHWIYWAAPIIGMVAAMQTYEMLRGAPARR